jgi:hypothetical protein
VTAGLGAADGDHVKLLAARAAPVNAIPVAPGWRPSARRGASAGLVDCRGAGP